MSQTGRSATAADYGLLALLGILLGIPYGLTKISQTTIPPLTGVAMRVALAAMVVWIFVIFSKAKRPKTKNLIPLLLIQGCISCAVPYALIAYGQTSVNSSLAAILNSTTPLFVCLISLLWTRGETLTFARLCGASAGLTGVVMIAGAGSLGRLADNSWGQAAIVSATALSAVASIQGRRLDGVSPELAAAGSLTCAAVILIPLCLVVDGPFRFVPSAGSIIALLVNAFIATGLRSVIFFRLLRTIGSIGTTSAGYLKPMVGVLVGCTFMGESLSGTAAFGLIAILVGVAAINHKQPLPALGRFNSKMSTPATPA